MYLHDLGASLKRRWYLVIVAIILTVAACVGVAKVVGPTYSADGAVVLLPPPDPENPNSNRFLSLGSLKQAADVVIRSLRNDSTQALVLGGATGAGYTVEPDYTTSAPVIVVHAVGTTPEAATTVLGSVLKQVPAALKHLQDELAIAPSNQIVAEGIDVDAAATYVMKGQMRAAAGVGVLVLGLLGVLIGAVDGWLIRRRQTRSDIHAVPVDDAKTEDPTPIDSAGRNPRRNARSRP